MTRADRCPDSVDVICDDDASAAIVATRRMMMRKGADTQREVCILGYPVYRVLLPLTQASPLQHSELDQFSGVTEEPNAKCLFGEGDLG